MLSSLTSWSQEHIAAIFEAPTEQGSLKALQETFSPSVKASINGKPLTYDDIERMVLEMRKEAPNGLKVHWLQTVEASYDQNNLVSFLYRDHGIVFMTFIQEGLLGGTYIIKGIYKMVEGLDEPVEHTRHKVVIVKWALYRCAAMLLLLYLT